MTKIKSTISMLGVFFTCLLFTSSASAQTPQWVTYVSSTGNNANDCTRSQPCQSIRAAILNTFAGGEVNVLDATNSLPLSIDKAITINGNNLATINKSTGPGPIAPHGIRISAGPDETVLIRGLSIFTNDNAVNGIEYLSGLHVIIEDCALSGRFVTGILAQPSTTGNLLVKNTTIQMQNYGNNDSGIKSGGPSALLKTVLENVRVSGRAFGLYVVNGQVTVKDSLFTHNYIGIFNGGGDLQVERSRIVANTGFGIQANAGYTHLTDVTIMFNPTGMEMKMYTGTWLNDVKVSRNSKGLDIKPGAGVWTFGNNKIYENGSSDPPNNGLIPMQ